MQLDPAHLSPARLRGTLLPLSVSEHALELLVPPGPGWRLAMVAVGVAGLFDLSAAMQISLALFFGACASTTPARELLAAQRAQK